MAGSAFSPGYFTFHFLRLLQLVHRGPAGRLHDRCAERGGHGFCRAQETPPARGRPAQGRSAAAQPRRAYATHSDPIAAVKVSQISLTCS